MKVGAEFPFSLLTLDYNAAEIFKLPLHDSQLLSVTNGEVRQDVGVSQLLTSLPVVSETLQNSVRDNNIY